MQLQLARSFAMPLHIPLPAPHHRRRSQKPTSRTPRRNPAPWEATVLFEKSSIPSKTRATDQHSVVAAALRRLLQPPVVLRAHLLAEGG